MFTQQTVVPVALLDEKARASAREKICEMTEHQPELMAKALVQHPEKTLRQLWDARVLEDVVDILLDRGFVEALWKAVTCVTGLKPARQRIQDLAFND